MQPCLAKSTAGELFRSALLSNMTAFEENEGGETGYYEGVYHSVTSSNATPVRGLFVNFPGDDGRIIGGVGIIEDISERNKAEKALELTRQSYFDIFNSAGRLCLAIALKRPACSSVCVDGFVPYLYPGGLCHASAGLVVEEHSCGIRPRI